MFKLAIICGGPSLERGISLNSARSFLDHTGPLGIDLIPLYVDQKLEYYRLTKSQLYSNTPSDFDFKLKQVAVPLSEPELIALLKEVDLVFPIIHGAYGEDGTLQAFLERHGIPFVGSSSAVCQEIFDKQKARERMRKGGFSTLPSLYIPSPTTPIEPFWNQYQLKEAILKPTLSGSSIGVTYVSNLESAKRTVLSLMGQGFRELVLEPYCTYNEFTVCVLQSPTGKATALIPMEMDHGNDPQGILDYRKKYLPTSEARYYCPPRFPKPFIDKIRKEAERLFNELQIRDFVRIDGWISSEGDLYFSDLNPISGMEQNSLIFQQSTRVGISHTDLIQHVLENALLRYGKNHHFHRSAKSTTALPVFVLAGGASSERQVALMTGTNAWLKLFHSEEHDPTLFLLDQDEKVWRLPYHLALHHTVEEICEHCELAESLLCQTIPLANQIRDELELSEAHFQAPFKMDLQQFVAEAKSSNAFVFLGLHGGIGESGELQRRLEKENISFNGCDAVASHLCMDKHSTAKKIADLFDSQILPMPQLSFLVEEDVREVWDKAKTEFGSEDLLVKPRQDGCSTGVVRVSDFKAFESYVQALRDGKKEWRVGAAIIQLPTAKQPYLLEPFIITDKFEIKDSVLSHTSISGWCEMTIGLLEDGGCFTAFHPSITVAEQHVLSVEEKFQGGTGINITPPPEHILSVDARLKVQERVCSAAKALGIRNYSRMDLFVELATGIIRIIEVNTLPALTPSTVFFHQALSTFPDLYPKPLFARLILSARNK